jgi:hypothetical protein
MHLRPVRLVLHLGAAGLLAVSGVLLTGTPGSAADADRPGSYGGEAAASAFHYVADRNPQPTPVTDAFHAEVPYATTSFDSSGGASATAASIYPGGGLLGVPALLCQFSADLCKVISNVPRYPFIATADYPTKKDDSADASPKDAVIKQPPLSVEPSVTTAHADLDRVEARTASGSTGIDGVVSAGSASTLSRQAFEGSTLVLTSESVVNGIDLGGGQLHIDQVRSVATARVDEGKISKATAVTTVSGATAGGQAVSIDSDGVHVAGNGDDGAARDAVNAALAALDASGMTVRMLDPTKKAAAGQGSATAGGLLITFKNAVAMPVPVPQPPPPLPGVPFSPNGTYTGSVTLAGAGVTGFATAGDLLDLPAVDTPAIGAPGPTLGGAQQPAAAQTSPLTAGAPDVAAPAAAAPSTAAPAAEPRAVLGVDLIGARLRTLSLVLLGYPLLVLLSAPLRAPARLPRF